MKDLAQLDVFYGDLTANRAFVYARLPRPADDAGLALTGFIRGPRCLHAETLPLTAKLVDLGDGPTLLARALVPEPCFWSPDLPAIYDVTVNLLRGTEIIATDRCEIGLRALGIRDRHLFLDGKRWVVRGVSSESTTATLARVWHEGSATFVATDEDPESLTEASQWGALTVAFLFDDPKRPIISRIRELVKYPAAAIAALEAPLPVDFNKAQWAPNLLLAQWISPENGHRPEPWADLLIVCADELDVFTEIAANAQAPIIAARFLDGRSLDLESARAACDVLQRDLAPIGQFAGYIVQTDDVTTSDSNPLDLQSSRYARQMRFAPIGVEGQRKLLASRALVVGCGALGSVIANTLARAGVGRLRIVDRDFLELNNLQRQVLYDEDDVAAGLPKAIAAKNRLARINSTIEIEAVVADVDPTNIERMLEGVDCLIDGTDNFETRFLLNDAAVKLGIPWIYGGCLGAEGQSLTILPGQTPCLRCLMPEPPPPGTTPTCDSAGILATIIAVIASLEANEAIKILSGHAEAVSRVWTIFDLWDNTVRQIKLDSAHSLDCPCCGRREFPWLAGERGSHTAILCGRNAVQLSFPGRSAIGLDQLEAKLATVGQVSRNKYLVRAAIGEYNLTVFPDGRAVIGGTEDIAEAKSVYAKYVGD